MGRDFASGEAHRGRAVTRLEDIKNGASVAGVVPNQTVEAVSVEWIGDQAINLVYRIPGGSVSEATLYRDDEHRLAVEQRGRALSFDADASLLRLSATPHNGKEEDFQLFMALLDGDRFEGRFRDLAEIAGEQLIGQRLRLLRVAALFPSMAIDTRPEVLAVLKVRSLERRRKIRPNRIRRGSPEQRRRAVQSPKRAWRAVSEVRMGEAKSFENTTISAPR